MPVQVAQLNVKIGVDDNAFRASLKRTDADVKRFAGSVAAAMRGAADGALGQLGASLKTLGSNMRAVGGSMTAAITVPVVGAVGASIKAFEGYEKSLRDVDSVSQLSRKEFQQLHDGILDLAKDRNIRQMPEDLAKGAYRIWSSGHAGKEGLEVLKEAAYGASGGMTDATTSSRLLLTALNSHVKGADNARQAMDTLMREVQLGVNTYPELAASMGTVLPAAKLLGASIQEVTAMEALMTRNGFNMARSNTAIMNLMLKIVGPTGAMTDAMDQLGIKYGQTALKGRDFGAWLEDANKKMVAFAKTHDSITIGKREFKITGADDLMKRVFPDTRAFQAFAVAEKHLKEFRQLYGQEMDSTKGVGATMAALQRQNAGLSAQSEKLKQELNVLGISIGESLAPSLRKLVGYVTEGVHWFSALSQPVKDTAMKAALVAAAVGPVLVVVGSLTSALGSLLSVASTVGPVLEVVGAALTGPIGAGVAIAAGAVALLAVAWNRDWGHIREVTAGFVAWIRPYLQSAWEWIKGNAVSVWTAIKDFLARVWPEIKTIGVFVWTELTGFLKYQMEFVEVVFRNTWNSITGVLRGAWQVIKGVVQVAWGVVAGVITSGLDLLTGDWRKAWDDVRHYALVAWDGLVNIVKGAIGLVVNVVKGAAQMLWNAGKAMIDGLVGGMDSQNSGLRDAGARAGEAATRGVTDHLEIHSPSRVWRRVGIYTAQGLAEGLHSGHGLVVDAATGLTRAAEGALRHLRHVSDETRDAIKEAVKDIFDMTHSEGDQKRRDAREQYSTDLAGGVPQVVAQERLLLKLKEVRAEEKKAAAERKQEGIDAASRVGSSIVGQFLDASKAAAESARAQQEQADNVRKYLVETNLVSLQDYQDYLKAKESALVPYSAAWIEVDREIAAVGKQAEDQAKAALEVTRQWLDSLVKESETETKERENLFKWEYDHQMISLQQYRDFLQQRLAGLVYLSEEWRRVMDQILGLDKAVMEAAAQSAGKVADAAKPKLDAIQEQGKQFAQQLADGLTNVVGNALDRLSKGHTRNFFGNLLKDLDDTLRQMAVNFLKSQFMRLITRVLGVGVGGSDGGGVWNEIPGKAVGGPVDYGTPYIVGEKGPELFVPRSSGRIVPNSQLAATGAGGMSAPVIYMTVHAQDAGSFRQTEPQIGARLLEQLQIAQRRNG
jgi:TP901 family phage tail tape measure protein